MKRQQIRIIGGIWRSRRISVIDGPGLRPSSDRNRETLFNWLAPYLENSRCLDLFAGSGILSFESLSRGASHVTAIELSKKVSRQIKASAALLQTGALSTATFDLIETNALKWLQQANTPSCKQPAERFNICFIDPPFRQSILHSTLEKLEQSALLAENAIIYIEHEQEITPLLPPNWKKLQQKKAGQVVYALYQR